jgi:hypothetical protein
MGVFAPRRGRSRPGYDRRFGLPRRSGIVLLPRRDVRFPIGHARSDDLLGPDSLPNTAQRVFGNSEAAIRQDAADTLGIVSNPSLTLDGVAQPLPPPVTSLLDHLAIGAYLLRRAVS